MKGSLLHKNSRLYSVFFSFVGSRMCFSTASIVQKYGVSNLVLCFRTASFVTFVT